MGAVDAPVSGDHRPVITEQDYGDGVVGLTLNRPTALNAFDVPLYLETAAALRRHDTLKATRIIVLAGSGARAFTAGMDLFANLSNSVRAARVFMSALVENRKIVVVVCHGQATGIGTTLLLHCDKVFAHPKCLFSTPFSSIGIVPEFASSLLFLRVLGHDLTTRLLLRGESVTAADMERVGLVQVLQAESRDSLVRDVIDRMIAWSREMPSAEQWNAVLDAKRMIREPNRAEVRRAIANEFNEIDQTISSGRSAALVAAKVERMMARRQSKL